MTTAALTVSAGNSLPAPVEPDGDHGIIRVGKEKPSHGQSLIEMSH
jgi:hypothetical protein